MACVQYEILADMFSIHQPNGETTIEDALSSMYLFNKDADFEDLLEVFYGPTPLAFAMRPIVQIYHQPCKSYSTRQMRGGSIRVKKRNR